MRHITGKSALGYDGAPDVEWLVSALSALTSNTWESETPLYFDGKGWSESMREEVAISLLNAVRENTSATMLVLRDAELDLKGVKALNEAFEGNDNLQSVTLKNLKYDSRPLSVPESIFRTRSLTSLHIERCKLDADNCGSLAKLLESSPTLESLVLTKVKLQGKLSSFARAVEKASKLQSLSLIGFEIEAADLNECLTAVGKNGSITSLRLENLRLGEEHSDSLAGMIRSSSSLEELSLRRNNLDGDAIKVICDDGLSQNRSLRALFVSQNPVGDDGAGHFVDTLTTNKTLQRLCLVKADIWREGCLTLLKGLEHFETLSHISLDGNDMDLCCTSILGYLRKNYTLYHLMDTLPFLMRSRDASEAQMWQQVDHLLRMNKAKRRVLIEDNVPSNFLPYILERGAQSKPDVLFDLLRQLPQMNAIGKH